MGFGSKLRRLRDKYIPDEISNPIGDVVDFIDDDILDPAGEFLEEEILDPAGEFLGEEIAAPARKFLSKATPREIQFLAGKLGGMGGGKAGAALAALLTGNPLLLLAAGATGAALGDVAGDYLTTDENEEFDIDALSAAFSALSGGLAGADAANPGNFKELGNTGIRAGDAAVSTKQMAELKSAADAGQTALDAANAGTSTLTAVEAARATQAVNNLKAVQDAGLAVRDLTAMEGIAGLGRDFVSMAQPYVDPFQGADFNPFSENFLSIDPTQVGGGTITDVLSSGGGLKDLGSAALKTTALPGGEAVARMGMEYYEAMEKAEDDYRRYLEQRGLRADQVQSQNRTLRRKYYNQSFQIRGYSSEEIAEILLRAKLIDSIEEYDPTDLPEGRKFGEDVTNDTVYAAQGGRIGFQDGSNEMLMQDNMKVGDYIDSVANREVNSMYPPGQPGMGRELPPGLPGLMLPTPREEQQERTKDKMTLVEDYMKRLNNMSMGGGRDMGMAEGGIMRSKHARGTDPYMERYREKELDPFEGGYEPGDGPERFPDYEGVNPFNKTPGNASTMGGRDMFQKARIMQIQKMFEAGQISREEAIIQMRNVMSAGTVRATMNMGGLMRSKNAMGTRTTAEGDPISPDVPAGMQMDLRGGGFIPLGTKPRADDVPAMVGKDEFVLNDRAVAGIGKLITGQPDARAGARVLYKLQNEMEASV